MSLFLSALAELRKNSVEKLNLEDCLEIRSILETQELANALAVNTSLKVLNLSGVGIGDDGAGAIASVLSVNQTLEELDFQRNKIGPIGAGHIAMALTRNTTLKVLYLGINEIGPGGVASIAHAISGLSGLIKLDLQMNYVGDVGCESIANALKTNRNLEELLLGKNEIGTEGGTALSLALSHNSTLKTLFLNGNSIPSPMMKRIHLLLHKIDSISSPSEDFRLKRLEMKEQRKQQIMKRERAKLRRAVAKGKAMEMEKERRDVEKKEMVTSWSERKRERIEAVRRKAEAQREVPEESDIWSVKKGFKTHGAASKFAEFISHIVRFQQRTKKGARSRDNELEGIVNLVVSRFLNESDQSLLMEEMRRENEELRMKLEHASIQIARLTAEMKVGSKSEEC